MSRFEKPEHFVVLILGIGLASAALITLINLDVKHRHHLQDTHHTENRSFFALVKERFYAIWYNQRNEANATNVDPVANHHRRKRDAVVDSPIDDDNVQNWKNYDTHNVDDGNESPRDSNYNGNRLTELVIRKRDVLKQPTNKLDSSQVIDDDNYDEDIDHWKDSDNVKHDERRLGDSNAQSQTRYVKTKKPKRKNSRIKPPKKLPKRKKVLYDRKLYTFLTNFSTQYDNAKRAQARSLTTMDVDKNHWCFSALELIIAVVGSVAVTVTMILTLFLLCFCCCYRRKKLYHDYYPPSWWVSADNMEGSMSCVSYEGKCNPVAYTKSYIQLEQNEMPTKNKKMLDQFSDKSTSTDSRKVNVEDKSAKPKIPNVKTTKIKADGKPEYYQSSSTGLLAWDN